MKTEETIRSKILLLALALAVATLWPPALSAGDGGPTGTWYLALDAEPFGLPPGTNLPGLFTFHRDKTFLVADAGDHGGLPFDTRHTTQFGTWRRAAGQIEAVSLFLQADAVTGEVRSWQKVHFVFLDDGPNRLVGVVNVFDLACDEPAPFPVFGCPDPIDSASEFVALPPFDVPILLKRLKARFDLPD